MSLAVHIGVGPLLVYYFHRLFALAGFYRELDVVSLGRRIDDRGT